MTSHPKKPKAAQAINSDPLIENSDQRIRGPIYVQDPKSQWVHVAMFERTRQDWDLPGPQSTGV